MEKLANLLEKSEKNNDTRISYFLLRQFIGLIGIFLPFTLVIFTMKIQPSISHYYYSTANSIFTGALCALFAFLFTYKGNYKFENIITNFAGVFAAMVAFFPTNFEHFIGERYITIPKFIDSSKMIETIHYIAAALLFICFSLICFFIFTKPDEEQLIDTKKKRRNSIYITCGIIMVISMLYILLQKFFPVIKFKNSTFWFETFTLLPFGFSWLLKGSFNWKHSKYDILKIVIKPFR